MRSTLTSGSRWTIRLAVLLALTLLSPLQAAEAATLDRAVRTQQQVPSQTEDGYYCRYVRGMSGAFYYKGLGTTKEWVPVGELHTGGNVRGQFSYGTEMSTSLSGGFSGDAGKTWSASLSIGRTTSYKVNVEMGVVKPDRHRKVMAQFKYRKVQVVCTDKDPRSGQIVRRDYTPRYRYIPGGWTANMKYARAGTAVPKCRTGRGSVPEQKIYLPHGQKKSITWTEGYRVSASLSGIGVKGTFESSSQTSKAVAFWTTRGRTYICGNKTALDDSTRFYTNWK
jgi:hypothetical protein